MKAPVTPVFALALLFLERSPGFTQTEEPTPVPVIEAYDSWKMATKGSAPLTEIQAPEGFAVDLIHTATDDEDSWVGMAFDSSGRIYLGKEQQGILRLTLQQNSDKNSPTVAAREVVNEDLEECRGLLWAHDSLYANANDSKGFYRLQDTNGDDRFDRKTLLLATEGGVGHGRNHLRLGPDGFIYLVHGNNPWLSEEVESPDSPYKNWGEDQLIPNLWDDSWNKLPAPAGYILKTDKEGKTFTRICGGLRNPLDMDFNKDGEIFVYDADSEWDAGLAWYKPTRVLHIVSGGEYGWRRGTGKWPAYYPDSLPASIDIGLGSPTGVGFGYESNFPQKWKNAFFIADWSYGRVLAVTLSADGASYSGEKETFLSGRPLNLTDFVFHDGAMWFITGGRRTQSALYRVRWTGEEDHAEHPQIHHPLLPLRKELESYHTSQHKDGTSLALEHLDHEDRFIRFAARVALEHQPVSDWQDQVLASRSATGLLALARVGSEQTQKDLINAIHEDIKQGMVDDLTLLTHLRTLQLSFIRQGKPGKNTQQQLANELKSLFPGDDRALNHELVELLVYLKASQIIDPILEQLEVSDDTRDWSHYLVFLRYIEDGWTLEQRRRYLMALRRFEEFPGGRWYVRTAQDLRTEAVAALTEAERESLSGLLTPAVPASPAPPVTVDPAVFVKNYSLADFDGKLKSSQKKRSLKEGQKAFHQAGCAACHKMSNDPSTQNAILGPDLSGVGARFNQRAMLESIIHPSRVIGDKYQNPAAPNISTMPPGLINGLTEQQILDLLHYLTADHTE